MRCPACGCDKYRLHNIVGQSYCADCHVLTIEKNVKWLRERNAELVGALKSITPHANSECGHEWGDECWAEVTNIIRTALANNQE